MNEPGVWKIYLGRPLILKGGFIAELKSRNFSSNSIELGTSYKRVNLFVFSLAKAGCPRCGRRVDRRFLATAFLWGRARSPVSKTWSSWSGSTPLGFKSVPRLKRPCGMLPESPPDRRMRKSRVYSPSYISGRVLNIGFARKGLRSGWTPTQSSK